MSEFEKSYEEQLEEAKLRMTKEIQQFQRQENYEIVPTSAVEYHALCLLMGKFKTRDEAEQDWQSKDHGELVVNQNTSVNSGDNNSSFESGDVAVNNEVTW